MLNIDISVYLGYQYRTHITLIFLHHAGECVQILLHIHSLLY